MVTACSKDDIASCENCAFSCLESEEEGIITNLCLDNHECSFEYFKDSRIDLDEFQGLGNGDDIVFQMTYSTEGDPIIADDEYTKILVFQIGDDQDSFSADDDDLKLLNVHFRSICFCADTEWKEIDSGCLQGEKQDDGTWYIQGFLAINYSWGSFDEKLEAQFTLN